jgi:hypothetical protein
MLFKDNLLSIQMSDLKPEVAAVIRSYFGDIDDEMVISEFEEDEEETIDETQERNAGE